MNALGRYALFLAAILFVLGKTTIYYRNSFLHVSGFYGSSSFQDVVAVGAMAPMVLFLSMPWILGPLTTLPFLVVFRRSPDCLLGIEMGLRLLKCATISFIKALSRFRLLISNKWASRILPVRSLIKECARPFLAIRRKIVAQIESCDPSFPGMSYDAPIRHRWVQLNKYIQRLRACRSRISHDEELRIYNRNTVRTLVAFALLLIYSLAFSQVLSASLNSAERILVTNRVDAGSLWLISSTDSNPLPLFIQFWAATSIFCLAAFIALYRRETVKVRRVITIPGLLLLLMVGDTLSRYTGFIMAQNPIPEVRIERSDQIGLAQQRVFLLGENEHEYELLGMRGTGKSTFRQMPLLTLEVVKKDEVPLKRVLGATNVFGAVYQEIYPRDFRRSSDEQRR